MKLNKLLSGLALVCLVSGASAANLVTNGDFATGSFGAWSSLGNASSVDNVGGTNGFVWSDSAKGSKTDSISQTFNTVAGTTYTLSFDLNGITGTGDTFSWSFPGTQTTSVTNATSGWKTFTTSAVAASTSSTLTFYSHNTGNHRFMLDNVSMTTPVPEPETYAMLLAGLGLIGTIAGRRKQKSAA